MMDERGRTFAFGRFLFNPRAHALHRDGRRVELGSRALDVLLVLLEANGDLVAKGTLMDRVWPDVTVEENNLQVQVSALRKVLGNERNLIRTIPGRGYRFAGSIRSEPPEGETDRSDPDADEDGGHERPDAGDRRQLSIVVLPFVNLGVDASLDYIVDGITDSLTTVLSRRLPGSFVISRSTAFTYKNRAVDVRSIGEQLGVRYVLEGSVLPAGETIRLNAQLIDTVTDMHLWAERFDKPSADVLSVQDEIVGRLSRSVGLQVTRHEASRVHDKPNPQALDLALRGRAVVHGRITMETAEQAAALFRQALERDPAHVEALVELASVLVYQVVNFYRADRDAALGEATALLEQALASDPTHLGALNARATVTRAQGSFLQAIAMNQTVIAQNPGDPTAYREIGLNYLYLGCFEDAVTWFTGADRIAPLDPIRWTWLQGLGRALVGLGEDEAAVEALEMAVESRPGVPEIYGLLAAAQALAGRLDRARERLADYARRETGMTIQRWAARSHVSLNHVAAAYLLANNRLLDGLRQAGMPES